MSQYDDEPGAPGPGDRGEPGDRGPADEAAVEQPRRTEPLADEATGPSYPPSYPPPSLSGGTPADGSSSRPPGQQPVPPWGSAQPPGQPGPYDAPFGLPDPYGHRGPDPAPSPQQAAPRSGLPGWAWPVITALALVVGMLGGVLGGVAVSSSMRSNDASPPPISLDNGAAAPLKPQNGSVAAVAARLLPSTVQIQARGGAGADGPGNATGSGIVLDGKGHVVTNNHVVAGATDAGDLKVVDQDGVSHPATIVGRSAVYDLAILRVSARSGLRPAAIGSSRRLRVGDTVVAIGSPLGLSSTVTTGVVSATDRPVTTGDADQSFINALQTDAAINPGNSGGPLVDLRGQVVGVNSAIATTGGVAGGQSGNIGVGFAIPIEQVRVTAGQILRTGEARYPVIGANVQAAPDNSGARVDEVPSGTPAAEAGLRAGDVVTGVDGKPVTDNVSLIVAIRSHQPGQTVALRVRRDGRATDVRVRLDSKVG